ncbi:hypothetical protein GGR54DRAFT_640438 [Hypoxylon sp. NC1633]|nr:hypothetical protein GGR54DRAFT_640438 [Hypoxylon sp. NC1633]
MADLPLEEDTGHSYSDSPESLPAKGGRSRPSFTDYWKRTKAAATRRITFVSSNLEQPAGPSSNDGQQEHSDPGNQSGKAQARRAQVRKAQIQHRQRKANYTKQLEMDVAKWRDLIEEAERESQALRRENDAIRRCFHIKDAAPDLQPKPQPSVPPAGYSETATAAVAASGVAPDYTVSLLSTSESTNSPLFQVQRTSTPSSLSWSSHSRVPSSHEFPEASGSQGTDPITSLAGLRLSEAQTDYAINFILGLEHVCWDHFDPSYYRHNDFDPEAHEHGHILMASAIALQSAPPEAWEQLNTAMAYTQQQQPSSCPIPPNPATLPSKAYPTTTTTTTPFPPTNPPNPPTVLATWHTPASPSPTPTPGSAPGPSLTLESLHGLASTLNPADGPELAPVQAYFEIARLYGGAAVRDVARMDAVRAELARSVECLHFGAVIRRDAFEDVLARVMGPLPAVAAEEGGVEGDLGFGFT